jgi:hypothetical protein
VREIDIVCPGCNEDLIVTLNHDGYAYGQCSYCGAAIEVDDGVVRLAYDLEDEMPSPFDLERWR